MSYSYSESDRLNEIIEGHLSLIRLRILEIANSFSPFICFGGGYGRGEGGVYSLSGVDRPYNDYDFFVYVPYGSRSKRRGLMLLLSGIKEELESVLGIHIDFSFPTPISSLSDLPYELMYMELKMGHRVVIGPPDLLSAMPDYDEIRPPLHECARLFMNRGVGLLLARQKLEAAEGLSKEDHEFVVRNIRKAQLAMGDSLLFLQESYSASYVERHKRFFTLDRSMVPDPDALGRYYDEAIDFKLRPQHNVPGNHTLSSWHAEVTAAYAQHFLWFEQQRLGKPGLTWEQYTKLWRRLPYMGLKDAAFNVLRNLRSRTLGLSALAELPLHPRDRVLARLPSLLFGTVRNKPAESALLKLWQPHG